MLRNSSALRISLMKQVSNRIKISFMQYSQDGWRMLYVCKGLRVNLGSWPLALGKLFKILCILELSSVS